jgi:hypothetical protein
VGSAKSRKVPFQIALPSPFGRHTVRGRSYRCSGVRPPKCSKARSWASRNGESRSLGVAQKKLLRLNPSVNKEVNAHPPERNPTFSPVDLALLPAGSQTDTASPRPPPLTPVTALQNALPCRNCLETLGSPATPDRGPAPSSTPPAPAPAGEFSMPISGDFCMPRDNDLSLTGHAVTPVWRVLGRRAT